MQGWTYQDLICTVPGAGSLVYLSVSIARLGIVFPWKHNNNRVYDRNDGEDPGLSFASSLGTRRTRPTRAIRAVTKLTSRPWNVKFRPLNLLIQLGICFHWNSDEDRVSLHPWAPCQITVLDAVT
jgi:hypothetical protein